MALKDFDAEWALPTYRLIRLLLVAFMLIIAYPYIPGAGSEAFKGISIFIDVVFSLGSLDVFNEYGVQIMTPAYEGEPEQPKVVCRRISGSWPPRVRRRPVAPREDRPRSGPGARGERIRLLYSSWPMWNTP